MPTNDQPRTITSRNKCPVCGAEIADPVVDEVTNFMDSCFPMQNNRGAVEGAVDAIGGKLGLKRNKKCARCGTVVTG